MKSKRTDVFALSVIAFSTFLFFVLISCNTMPVNDPDRAARPVVAGNPYYSRTDTTVLNVPNATWKKILPDSIYYIARGKGTERAFTGKFWNYDGPGTYYCAVCGNALFISDSKFASSCGWPSFFETLRKESVIYLPDTSLGMSRTEVQCGRCYSHLGHLFYDGPPPTGKRFCMNSIVLEFEPGKK